MTYSDWWKEICYVSVQSPEGRFVQASKKSCGKDFEPGSLIQVFPSTRQSSWEAIAGQD